MKAIQKYAAIFGRNPVLVREPEDGFCAYVALFTAIEKVGFFKSLMAEACGQCIYITSGLSQHSMPTPEGLPYKPVAIVP